MRKLDQVKNVSFTSSQGSSLPLAIDKAVLIKRSYIPARCGLGSETISFWAVFHFLYLNSLATILGIPCSNQFGASFANRTPLILREIDSTQVRNISQMCYRKDMATSHSCLIC
ncbi:hypothetical protein CHARACLAT_031049 [Characodon lateralis]|uniref:Uncharacterized protein n=1 Tax=Characodon lateralis TaxID=208331 RepID=A0ABU7CSS5_9TELE|nr:hypothetical protein [Characodon lateralis]